MSAMLQEQALEPDFVAIAEWARSVDFDLRQVDCLTAIMLKILDGKCQMDAETRYSVRVIYRQAHRQRSHLFDTGIHAFIEQVFEQPDLLSLRHIHELRLYAESAIEKPVMKNFKQFLWANMP